MPTAQDLADQKKEAIAHQQKTQQLMTKEKDLRRQQIAELDRQIAVLREQRNKASASL